MILLKFKTEIKGDSNIKDHVDWITLNSVNFSCGRLVSAHSGGTDRETSTPSFTDIQCKKEFDISSVELFMQSICGKSLGEANLHFMQTGGKDADQVYLKLILEDPIVTSYVHESSAGTRASESFSINFTKIKLEYTQFSGETKKQASPKGWDLKSGTAW